ncbi:MAG: hypothetical protein JXR83_19335 [Deltaproteobacteria bacterium]|nr:hypothetical protein [Deltaproteobacteria bacterium]
MSMISNFSSSFGRISNFTMGLDLNARLGLASTLGRLAQAAGLADLFGVSSMGAATPFTAFGAASALNMGAGFLPPVPQGLQLGQAFASGLLGSAMPLAGESWAASLQQSFSGYDLSSASFGGAGSLFGGWQDIQGALAGMTQVTMSQLALGMNSQSMMAGVGGFAAQSTSVATNPASFPPVKGDTFLNTLQPTNTSKGQSANAKALNVSGSSDVKKINKAIDKLGNAAAEVRVAKPGEKTEPGKLVLTADQVAAIRNAPDSAAAKEVLRGILEQQTGAKINSDMNDKNGIRKSGSRDAMNKLLGTKVRNGTEKNSGSSMVMDSMLESITAALRGGSFGTTSVTQEFAVGALGSNGVDEFGFFAEGSTNVEVENGGSSVAIDLDSYTDAAETVGELASPLIFDLEGTGLQLKHSGLIEVDLDGDGKLEQISDLSAAIGLLVFDAKQDDEGNQLTGRDMFGNNTDLSVYGIEGSFDNGFAALRALAEHYRLVDAKKQYLDAEDLLLLEHTVGLRMRVGGLVNGEDRSFAALGITRINLGDPDRIRGFEQSPEDMYGNKLMQQEGATFIVKGEERPYADIWFNIQARTVEVDVASAAIAGDKRAAAALLASMRR